MYDIKRGIAICHFNRPDNLVDLVQAVHDTKPGNCRVVVCDDGSREDLPTSRLQDVLVVRGPNLGVAANKNRALWTLQDCHFIAILEDDLFPTEKGWFDTYEKASRLSGINHFCRVQDREVPESVPVFSAYMATHGLTPIYGPSPRGDLTFLTGTVVRRIGAFNPRFRGAGYAHGEWSHRIQRAGLIGHPNKWVDIKEARDAFTQRNDTSGGRFDTPQKEIRKQLATNKRIYKQLQREDYAYHPLVIE